MSDELKSCPFCGWANPVWEVERHAYDWIEYAAYCANCDAKSKPAPTKQEAAAAWNRRADQPDAPAGAGVPSEIAETIREILEDARDDAEAYIIDYNEMNSGVSGKEKKVASIDAALAWLAELGGE